MISLGSRLIVCCKLAPTLARQMWRHNYVIDRNEYLIFTLSESVNPWVYSLQFLFKSTNNSWRYERKCEWVFFSWTQCIVANSTSFDNRYNFVLKITAIIHFNQSIKILLLKTEGPRRSWCIQIHSWSTMNIEASIKFPSDFHQICKKNYLCKVLNRGTFNASILTSSANSAICGFIFRELILPVFALDIRLILMY